MFGQRGLLNRFVGRPRLRLGVSVRVRVPVLGMSGPSRVRTRSAPSFGPTVLGPNPGRVLSMFPPRTDGLRSGPDGLRRTIR